jgi:hypothetical protein
MVCMATDTQGGGEWCGPTRELENAQLVSLVHASRKILTTETLRVDVEVTNDDDEVVMLVNKPPADAPVLGAKIDALPEASAVVLDPDELFDEVICDVEPVIVEPPRAPSRASSSALLYPMHRDTLRPVRIVLLVLLVALIGAGATVAALVV